MLHADILPQLLVMPKENKESVAEQNYYKVVKESLEEFKIVFEELVRYVCYYDRRIQCYIITDCFIIQYFNQ